jgi:hypothetical protein
VTITTSEDGDRQKPVNGEMDAPFVVGFLGRVGSPSRVGRARIGSRIQTLTIVFQYDINPRTLAATGAVTSQDSRTLSFRTCREAAALKAPVPRQGRPEAGQRRHRLQPRHSMADRDGAGIRHPLYAD